MAERQPPAGAPGLSMRWENLLFLHWAWSAADIQNTLPSGLMVDTLAGRAWLGGGAVFYEAGSSEGAALRAVGLGLSGTECPHLCEG